MNKSQHLITSRHYLILAVLAFAAGIFIATSFAALPFFYTALWEIGIVFCLGIILIIKMIRKSPRIKSILLPFFLILCCLAGSFRIVTSELLFPGNLKNHLNSNVWLTGTIVSRPALSDNGWTYSFELEVIQINDTDVPAENIVIHIPASRGNNLKFNNKICCWTQIQQASRQDISDNYDYYTHLRGKNIFYTGSTKNINAAKFTKPFSIVGAIKDFGRWANQKICSSSDSVFENNPSRQALLKGILVGNKSDFTDELYNKFSYSGLLHIVSVSGMHLSIIYGMFVSILNSIQLRKKYSVIIITLSLLIFASTAAFAPSVCRAALMYFIMLFSQLLKRQHSPLTALFFSLGVILICSPYALYSRSLTLSFCAALGIHLCYKYASTLISNKLPYAKKSLPSPKAYLRLTTEKILGSFIVSLAVCIATFGFSAVFFGRISYIQFLTNLWIVPLVSLTFILGYIACIAEMILPRLSTLLTYPLGWLLDIILWTAHTFGKEYYTIDVSSATSAPSFIIISFSVLILVYMTLKTRYDIHIQKKKRTLKAPTLR